MVGYANSNKPPNKKALKSYLHTFKVQYIIQHLTKFACQLNWLVWHWTRGGRDNVTGELGLHLIPA